MTPASAPITHAQALSDLRAVLAAAQKARSLLAEDGWADGPGGQRLVEDLNPWLYGKGCIIVPLAELIGRCEATGKVAPGDYMNILRIAHQSPMIEIGVALIAHRELPDPDLRKVFEALGDAL